ncbi:hypothetical protein VTL71DRAFT_14274 [Oculimacula yallundae]|uniref:Transmembrane protein n=1 Tax=Oculimacula yallundae TaxID=86028 RepID=A0ABR4CIN2_9HELO
MRFDVWLLVVAVQFFLPLSAQVVFSHPAQGEVISGNVPFVLRVSESTSAPFFSQMTNFSLFLMAGSYSSPITLFTWDISITNPSTVDNRVLIPSTAGTNANDAYFLGIRGSIVLSSTLSATYFSPIFTLQNMTGASSLIVPGITRTLTAATGTQTAVATSSPLARAINCIDPITGQNVIAALDDPSANNACVRSASSVLAVLATRINTAPAISRVGTTTIPTQQSVAPPTTAVGISGPSLGTAVTSSGALPTSVANTNPTERPTSSNPNGRYIYIAIIVTLAILAPIICLWLFFRHRRLSKSASLASPSSPTKEEPTSPFDAFRPLVSGLKGFAVLSKGNDQDGTKSKRKYSDAEKAPGLEVHVTRSLRYFSTHNSRAPSPTQTPNTPIITERRIMQQQAFEGPDTRRSSRRTILAELEGDSVIPPMPDQQPKKSNNSRESIASEIGRWRTDSDQAFESLDPQRRSEALSEIRDRNRDSGRQTEGGFTESSRFSIATSARRTVILSEGQEIRVVNGKDVANIVTFSKKGHHVQTQQPPPMPVRIPIPKNTMSQPGVEVKSLPTRPNVLRQQHPSMPVRIPIPKFTPSQPVVEDKSLPTRPHVAHLSMMPSTTPRIPVSRFSLRSASVSHVPSSPLPTLPPGKLLPSSPSPPKKLLPSSPKPPSKSGPLLSEPQPRPISHQHSRSRISTLNPENTFSEGQASVVVEGQEEEKRRKERREKKKEELLHGGTVGGSAVIEESVMWKKDGPVGSPTFGGEGSGSSV